MIGYSIGHRVDKGKTPKLGLPSGIYLVTEEEFNMCEEDNEDALLVDEEDI